MLSDSEETITIDGEKVNNVRNLLGLTQKDIARALHVSQPFISNVLSGSKKLSAKNWSVLFNWLQEKLREKQAQVGRVDFIMKAEEYLKDIETTFTTPQKFIWPPGAPIDSASTNYIYRKCDDVVLNKFNNEGWPFYANIIGPPQSGKTSLLSYIEKLAQERGAEICDLDLRGMQRSQELADYKSFLSGIRTRLALVGLIYKYPPEIDVTNTKGHSFVTQELIDALNRVKKPRLLLLVDSLDLLDRLPLRRELGDFLTLIVHWWYRGARDKIFRKLGIVTCATLVSSYDNAVYSSLWEHVERVNVGWFPDSRKVQQLATNIGLDKEDDCLSATETAWQMFQGQPYLTHLFLHKVSQSNLPSDIKEEAIGLKGKFGAHWDRVIFEISRDQSVNDRNEAWKILRTIAENEKGLTIPTGMDKFMRSLRRLHLIDPSIKPNKSFTISCDFYRHAILSNKTFPILEKDMMTVI